MQTRTFDAHLEVRATDTENTVNVRGYAAVFDTVSHGEYVARSAFNKTLNDGDDVRLMVNHDGVPLARTASGTLTLDVDDTGLKIDADLDLSNPRVAELTSAMSRGDLDQMSFAFKPVRSPMEDRNGQRVRALKEVKLIDVSLVTFPWYEATSAEVTRSTLDEALVAVRSGRPLTAEQTAALRDAVADAVPPVTEPVPAAESRPRTNRDRAAALLGL